MKGYKVELQFVAFCLRSNVYFSAVRLLSQAIQPLPCPISGLLGPCIRRYARTLGIVLGFCHLPRHVSFAQVFVLAWRGLRPPGAYIMN